MPTFLYAASLADAQTVPAPTLTVEAEYGTVVVEGSLYTAAHHQPSGPFERCVHPAPCNDTDIPVVPDEATVLVSHFDLDTAAGCLRALPGFEGLFAPEHDAFWRLAEDVDLNGAHKVRHLGGSEQDVLRLHAYWAWARADVPRFPREGVHDVTVHVLAAGRVLTSILAGEASALTRGREFMADEDGLNTRSFVRLQDGVIMRSVSDPRDFVNHLYTTPEGVLARAVITLNTGAGSVTVSLADPVPGVSCRDMVQGLWGPEAGGHPGIAGSPRGQAMTEADAEAALQALLSLI